MYTPQHNQRKAIVYSLDSKVGPGKLGRKWLSRGLSQMLVWFSFYVERRGRPPPLNMLSRPTKAAIDIHKKDCLDIGSTL